MLLHFLQLFFTCNEYNTIVDSVLWCSVMTHVRQSVISVVILSYFDDVTLRMKIKHAKCGQY